jgi:hypothetical protein
VDGRGGRARVSVVVAAPGVRRDAEDGDQAFGRWGPAAKVGQAALVRRAVIEVGSLGSTVRRRRAASRRVPEAGRAVAPDGAWRSRSGLRELVSYPACQLSLHPASAPR